MAPPTAFLPITPLLPPQPHTQPTHCRRRGTILAQGPHGTNSPTNLPYPTPPHTPYPNFHTSESESVDTQFEQPPGGSPPPSDTVSRHSSSSDDGDGDDESLPNDVREALAQGALTKSALSRYKREIANPFLAFLYAIPAFRSRALADPAFLFKLVVQIIVGDGTALASEIVVRGKEIMHELEYVASDIIVGTFVEAAFVWLLAPTLKIANGGGSGILSRLPSHVFERSNIVRYTLQSRVLSFLYAGMQYAMIGFVAGVVGTGVTYGLIEGRKWFDTSYQPERPMPDVLPNSLGWAAFMALSSNPRFQIVEGLELAVTRFCGAGVIANGSIVTLRFINNYWGGVQFVQFFRLLGLHATGEEEKEKVM